MSLSRDAQMNLVAFLLNEEGRRLNTALVRLRAANETDETIMSVYAAFGTGAADALDKAVADATTPPAAPKQPENTSSGG